MRAIVVALFGLLNVLASSPLFNSCAKLSRFSYNTCEVMRLGGLLVVFVILVNEMLNSSDDRLPLLWTAVLTSAIALARSPETSRHTVAL